MSFAVVEFLGTNDSEINNEVSVVPSKWIVDRQCYWPTRIGKKKFEEFVKELPSYKSSWTKFKIHKILFKTDDYGAADEFINNFLDENVSSVSGRSVRKGIMEEEDLEGDSLEEIPENILADMLPPGDLISFSSTVTRPSSTQSANVLNTTPSSSSSMEKIILDEICRLNVLINQQSTMLSELLRNSRTQMVDVKTVPAELPNFPLKTMEEFNKFNEKITEEHIRRYMISRLCAVGGAGIEGLTRRMLKFVMTDQLACAFNWKGRGEKISFEKCQLASLLIEAAKRDFPDAEKNDLLVADTIKLWLKYAPSRISKARI